MPNNFKEILVPYNINALNDPWQTMPAALHQPMAGGLVGTNRWPLIISLHGNGAGIADGVIYSEGLPNVVELNGSPMASDGTRFIVLAPRRRDRWTPDGAWMGAVAEWAIKNLPIDPNRIYITGWSAGGQEAMRALILPETSKYFAAGLPMSVAGYDKEINGSPSKNFANLKNNNIGTWFFCGTMDDASNANTYNHYTHVCFEEAEVYTPDKTDITVYEGGHGPWQSFFKNDYKGGKNKISVWDFLLKHVKGVIPQPTPTPTPVPPAPKSPIVGVVMQVTYADKTVDLLNLKA